MPVAQKIGTVLLLSPNAGPLGALIGKGEGSLPRERCRSRAGARGDHEIHAAVERAGAPWLAHPTEYPRGQSYRRPTRKLYLGVLLGNYTSG